jgi:subtilisin family serine protease
MGIVAAILALSGTAYDLAPIRIDGILCHPGRLIVKVRDRAALSGLSVREYIPELKLAVIETTPKRLLATRARLTTVPGVERVELDRAAKPAYDPNDPKWGDLWHMRTIRADVAWNRSLGSNQGVVAIMDTGVDVAHEDLAANIWQNPKEIAGNGVDDDNNGYVDDTYGWDFVANDAVTDDVHGHGTACAGIAAAVGDNNIGMVGVAPRARIMALKAARNDGYFFLSSTLPAYIYAAKNGARALSMSFYSDSLSPAEREAIDYCAANGTLPVAAAGNDSTVLPYYPGAYENTLSVAAINQDLSKSGFSDWGSWVDVAAPGTGLTATKSGGGYQGFGGTSGACPHVAGLAALIFGAKPSATVAEVRNAIENTSRPLIQAPFGEYTTYGLVDSAAALDAVLDGDTAVRHAPMMRYATPIGKNVTTRIYGRSLRAAPLEIFAGNQRRTPSFVSRDYADVPLGAQGAEFGVFAGFRRIGTVVSPFSDQVVYPFIEGSTRSGGQVIGGFWDSLNVDRDAIRVTRQNGGQIVIEGTFRRVPSAGVRRMVIRRKYVNCPDATEKIEVYNWSTASYPYGSWSTVREGAASASWSRQTLGIPTPSSIPDYEGSVYVRITTSAVPENGELLIDQLVAY